MNLIFEAVKDKSVVRSFYYETMERRFNVFTIKFANWSNVSVSLLRFDRVRLYDMTPVANIENVRDRQIIRDKKTGQVKTHAILDPVTKSLLGIKWVKTIDAYFVTLEVLFLTLSYIYRR